MAESDDEDKKIKRKKKEQEESENDFFKKIATRKFKRTLIIVLIFILVIVIIASSLFNWRVGQTRNSNDPESPAYAPFGPYAYFSKIYVTDDGTLMPGMSVSEMWKSDKRYSMYLSNEDALAYLLNAQVVTQYPYIESAKEGELNGTIRFYRNDSDDAMKYVSAETLNEYVKEFNEKGDTDARDKALNSFTMDGAGTITIAHLMSDSYSVTTNDSYAAGQAKSSIGGDVSSSSGSYSVSKGKTYLETTSLSYYSYIQKYVLPFNLLWSMLIIGGSATGTGSSENFVHTIASMAYAGEIKLAIDDKLNTTKYYKNYTYNEEQKYEGTLSFGVSHSSGEGETSSSSSKTYTNSEFSKGGATSSYKANYKETHIKSTPTIIIRKLESWVAVYNNDAEFKSTTVSNKLNPIKTKESDSEWRDCGTVSVSSVSEVADWESTNLDAYMKENSIPSRDKSKVHSSSSHDVHLYKRYVDINVSSYTEVQTKGYNNGTVTSPSFNIDMARMFKVYAFGNVKKFLGVSSYRSFIRALENNEDTANMVDIIKYIFNKVYDTDSYGSDLVFDSIFASSNGGNGFSSVDDSESSSEGSSDAGNAIIEIAKSKLGSPYVYGATGPNSFDCSGFVFWVYGQKGIKVPRSTDGYTDNSKEIPWSEAQPGDILIVRASERGTSNGHAGIYLGDDKYIHAPQTGDVVKISDGAKSKFKHVFRYIN